MNAEQAKGWTYSVNPPVQPPIMLYDAIYLAAQDGKRSVQVPSTVQITEEMEWWLQDEGYHFTTIDDVVTMGRHLIIRIHW